ncbi:MAG: endonuclease/exonuclease/phosphatase family protein [Bdellovibrionales bacterium]|nr:endonuclease/exonuclease/phosphatase family protein [Bdellovibrionales bacterium]
MSRLRGLLEKFRALIHLAGAALIVATYCGFFDSYHWSLDLLTHFRPQYLVGLVSLGLAALVVRSRLFAVLLMFHAGLNAAVMSPYFEKLEERSGQPQAEVKLLLFNLNQRNTNYDAVVDFVRSEQPDVAIFIEVGIEWDQHLRQLTSDLPQFVSEARDDNFGIALYSKLPLLSSRVELVGEVQRPTIFADLMLGSSEITVVGTHPVPPGSEHNSYLRNDHLSKLADVLRQQRRPILFAGDMNITPWSSHYRDFLERSGLLNAARGRWILWTWPSTILPLAIPIDHVLISTDFNVKGIRKGPSLGSDHYPVIAQLELVR